MGRLSDAERRLRLHASLMDRLDARVLTLRGEVERLKAELLEPCIGCASSDKDRKKARAEVDRLKANAPSERAIVIEPNNTTAAHNICLAVQWLQTHRDGYRSDSDIDVIYSLLNQSGDYVDAEVELLRSRPPTPAPDGPCVLRGEVSNTFLGRGYTAEVRIPVADRKYAESLRKQFIEDSTADSHLEIVPADPPKTDMVTKWIIRSELIPTPFRYDSERDALHDAEVMCRTFPAAAFEVMPKKYKAVHCKQT